MLNLQEKVSILFRGMPLLQGIEMTEKYKGFKKGYTLVRCPNCNREYFEYLEKCPYCNR